MVEVVACDEFTEWYDRLDEDDSDAVGHYVDLLEARGTTLPFPYCSAIKGSKYALRELRVQSGGKPLRVFYIFDPLRQAVVLIGADKTGDDSFYGTFIPVAESIWEAYLVRIQGSTP